MMLLTWANLSWGAPAWGWAAIAAIALPVAAHLISRLAAAEQMLPTARFLERAVAHNRRARQLRERTLLALRILALGLMVAAFAQPSCSSNMAANNELGRVLVIVLDASASMTRLHHGSTLFERGQQQAIRSLQQLDPSTDAAVVVLAQHTPRLLLPQTSANFSHLQTQLAAAAVTHEQGDLNQAITAGLDLCRDDPRPLQLLVLSDLQQTAFSDVGALALPANVEVQWKPLGRAADNLALFNAMVTPTQPIAHQPVTFAVDLAWFTPAADAQPRRVQVTCTIAEHPHVQEVELAPNQPRTLWVQHTPTGPGLLEAHWQVQLDSPDELMLDDQIRSFVRAESARRVTVVTDADIGDARSAAYFVTRALQPALEGPFSVAVLAPSDLADQTRSRYARGPMAMVVVDASIDNSARDALEQYLEQGGGVLWIADSETSAAQLNDWYAAGATSPLSPIIAGDSASWRQGAFALGDADWADQTLREFESSSRSALLGATFKQRMEGQLNEHADARALLRFADDVPALAWRWVGSGRLAVLAASLAPDRSDLVQQPPFVPLLHELLQHLTPGRPPEPTRHPGMPLQLHVPEDAQPSVALHVASPDQPSQPTIDAHGARWTSADRAGVYQLFDSTNKLLAAGQVEIDPRESDLRRSEPAVGAFNSIQSITHSAADRFNSAPQPQPLWPWLLVAALTLLAGEQITLGFWHLADQRAGGADA